MKYFSFLALMGLLAACQIPEHNGSAKSVVTSSRFQIEAGGIRALKAYNDQEVWFSGTGNRWGYTQDGGENWTISSVPNISDKVEFRSLEKTPNGHLYLVSIQSPAAVYRSVDGGENWRQIFTDTSSTAFFDAVKFWDDSRGILLGDPKENHFQVYLTADGGDTWTQVDTSALPKALPDEFPFAASNSNFSIFGSHVWFATGGKSASRVYHSPDYGQSWEVFTTPIMSGLAMTGIYAVDFKDELTGVVAGGDWSAPDSAGTSLALTQDGGKTWQVLNSSVASGYFSSIRFAPGSSETIIAVQGRMRDIKSKILVSKDLGQTWKAFPEAGCVAFEFASDSSIWLSGSNQLTHWSWSD
ncbi:hypothetical protein KFE98_08185 [bacterium SCSIO 12741]|nr:hypothetical protein KFE98_08185 [bacterium SCSIO 12741]